jgi:hypothetical protein
MAPSVGLSYSIVNCCESGQVLINAVTVHVDLGQNHFSGKPTSAYPVGSAKPDILGVVEASTTTAGGDLKQPDKQEPTNQDLQSIRSGNCASFRARISSWSTSRAYDIPQRH